MRITTDPTRELSLLQGDVNRVFERFFGPQGTTTMPAGRWVPALDIVEEGDRFLLHLDLPGMTDEDVEIELEDRVLRIAGERRDTRDRSRDGFRRVERSFGRFERSLTLPRGVDPEAISATFDRGVLEVSVPKPEETKPRRIAVNGGKAQHEIEGATSEDRELAHA